MTTQLEDVRRPQAYEPCEECGAPMDPQQRYCVNCAARRGNGANPSSRYFAAMSRRARRPLVAPPAEKESPNSRAAAVAFFALLPIAVALGVMVGRSGNDGGDNEALLQALREKQTTAASTATPGATGTAVATTKAKKNAKAAKSDGKPKEKVVAHTENGDVHEVTDFKASKQKEEEDTQLVQENPEQTGENYIKAQQNLPDVIVVGGEAGSAPAPSGVEP
ncbi:MAG TPA: hypothetical protein VFJ61_01325 [Solirubrobacterales bacterium]|nr:hypothetical protein [Solirubrobacterales bacterium]